MSKDFIIDNKNEKIIELLYSPEMVIEKNAFNDFICYSSAIGSENFDIDDLFINSILESGTNEKIIINQHEHVIEFLSRVEKDGADWKIVIFNNYKDNDAKVTIYAIYVHLKGKLVVLFFDFNEIFNWAIERLYLLWKEKEEINARLSSLSAEMGLRDAYMFINWSYLSLADSLTRTLSVYEEYGRIIDMIKKIAESCEYEANMLSIKVAKHMLIN